VIILQVYGSGEGAENDGNVSHSFAELYNPTDTPVSLAGCSIQYTEWVSGTTNAPWEKLDLSGTIPAKSSYLILGKEVNTQVLNNAGASFAGPNLKINAGDADATWTNKVYSNHSFQVVLLSNNTLLSNTVINPHTDLVPGYIDMVGVRNGKNDGLLGYEGTDVVDDSAAAAYRYISKQKAARRITTTDTDDNNADFESIGYAADSLLAAQRDFYRPKNTAYGSWNPAAGNAPAVPTTPTDGLLILQVAGNKGKSSAALSHSFVELYNNTDAAINLIGYSLQYIEGGTIPWQKLNLTGTIPAHGSYLVRGKSASESLGSFAAGGLDLTPVIPDQVWNIALSAVQFKLCLIQSTTQLNVANPFTANNGSPVAGYIDMFGAFDNDAEAYMDEGRLIDGYEGDLPAAILSKQKSVRRISLADNDENAYDFAAFDWRTGRNDTTARAAAFPRTAADGSYTVAW
jgi:hypothetical protein